MRLITFLTTYGTPATKPPTAQCMLAADVGVHRAMNIPTHLRGVSVR